VRLTRKEGFSPLGIGGGWKTYGFALFPVGITLLLYGSVLQFQFVWDDTIYLQSQLPAFQTYWDAFFPGEKVGQFYDRYYRPLIYVSYLFDRTLWGFNPWGYHLTVLLFHLACTLLVFFLSRNLFGEFRGIPWGAWMSSLFFGVHPMHIESVAWMSGRSDVISGFFMLVSLLFVLNHGEGKKKWFFDMGSSVFFLFALLSKETSISLLLIFPFVPLFWRKEKGGRLWNKMIRISILPVLVVIGYFLVRNWAMQSFVGDHLWVFTSLWDGGIRIFLAYGFYIWKMIGPFDFNAFIDVLPDSISFDILSLGLMGFFLGMVLIGLVKKKEFLFLGSFWVLATLFPSALIALTGVPTPLAERYLYIPSMGVSFLIGGLFLFGFRFLQGRRSTEKGVSALFLFFMAPFAFMLIGLMFLTWQRLPIWENNQTFWKETAEKNPQSWLPHQNLGLVFHENGTYSQAEREFQLALALSKKPEEMAATLTSFGITQMRQGKNQDAEKKFLQSLNTGVASPYVYYALGFLYTYQWDSNEGPFKSEGERFNRAKYFFQKAIDLNPYYQQAYFELGQLELRLGNEGRALTAYERFLSLSSGISSPTVQNAQVNLGGIYFRKGGRLFSSHQWKEALLAFRKAMDYQPQNGEIHFRAGKTLERLEQVSEAMQAYRLAVQYHSTHVQARYSLALLLEKAGSLKEAQQEYKILLSQGPQEGPLYQEIQERVRRLSGG
jgi:tetratricopeptide (TPR) repeat protein